MYMKCPEQQNLLTQKVDWLLPVVEGREVQQQAMITIKYKVSLDHDENILKSIVLMVTQLFECTNNQWTTCIKQVKLML